MLTDRTSHAYIDSTSSNCASELNPLSIELARLDRLFALHLSKLRQGGRSTLGDAVSGAVIEDGEAEGLLTALFETHTNDTAVEVELTEQWVSPLLGLERAKKHFNLSSIERDMLMLATAVELDSRYARLMAYLNDHVAMTRPTLGLAMSILAPNQDSPRTNLLQKFTSNGAMRRFNLIELEGDGPISSRTLKIPVSFWPRLIGVEATPEFPSVSIPLNRGDFVQSNSFQTELDTVITWAKTRPSSESLVVVVGKPGSGRDFVARQIAVELSTQSIIVDARQSISVEKIKEIARESCWHDSTVILRNADKMESFNRDQLEALVTCSIVYTTEPPHDTTLLESTSRRCTALSIPELDSDTRTQLWSQLSKRHELNLEIPSLVSRFGFGPGRINTALQLTSNIADPNDSQNQQVAAQRICRNMQRAQFDGLAQKLPCPFNDSDIVLTPKTKSELDLICTWANHSSELFSDHGIGKNLHTGKGLACLFSGPPGTGKTMGAQVIARRIGFDVYRIDLSQLVDKYVGETEKNLSRVFDEAQQSKAILFFDEAESVFGERSDVKSAQDRFANIEIGYLLQRIETFEGVAILATNLQKNLDEAFLRRLNVIAEFPIPGPEERCMIWQNLLPEPARRSTDIDIDLLSTQFNIAGGDIRNAIFSALLLAAEDQTELSMRHLVRGLWRELQKSGRIVDTAQFGVWSDWING